MSAPTALLVFAQSAAADARLKRLSGQPQITIRVLAQLNQRTRQLADATGLPVLHAAALIPPTGGFGEQLTAALSEVFARGFERVLVVGNDCPDLTTAHLTQAALALESASVVLGPDRRGGLYLLGLSRAAFERLPTGQMPWQTSQLARAIKHEYDGWSIAELSPLGDVNSRADLRNYQANTPLTAAFIRHLLAIGLATDQIRTSTGRSRTVRISLRTDALRGPPGAVAAVRTGTVAVATV